MTTEQLREVLAYPDEAAPIDLSAVVQRAGVIRRRRRALAAGLGITVTGVVLGSAQALLGGPGHDVVVQTPGVLGSASVSVTATSTPSTPPSPSAESPVTTRDFPPESPPGPLVEGERLSMGHGWKVWLRDDEVCRSAPGDTPMPFGCRSLTDGNIGGLNVQSSGSPTGVMMSGLIPYRPARLVVRHSGVELEPTLRRLDVLVAVARRRQQRRRRRQAARLRQLWPAGRVLAPLTTRQGAVPATSDVRTSVHTATTRHPMSGEPCVGRPSHPVRNDHASVINCPLPWPIHRAKGGVITQA